MPSLVGSEMCIRDSPILLTRQGICCFNTPPTPALTADLGMTSGRLSRVAIDSGETRPFEAGKGQLEVVDTETGPVGRGTFSLDAPRKCVLSASRDARMPF